MIKIYIQKIENFDKKEIENIKNTLSEEALARLNKKRNEALHLASLCALSLLSDEQRADLSYTKNGAPFFNNLDQDISISHSQNYTAVAISTSKNEKIGVDIEESSSVTPSTRFFTENEKQTVTNTLKFLEIWTKKEALFKFLKNDPTPFIKLDSTTPEKYGASFSTVKINDCVITICKEKPAQIEIIQK